jgi:hypothetical protein
MADISERAYQFKIVILKISPMVWRRILVPEKQTLAELLRAILILLQTRTGVLNDKLADRFRRWYPGFRQKKGEPVSLAA